MEFLVAVGFNSCAEINKKTRRRKTALRGLSGATEIFSEIFPGTNKDWAAHFGLLLCQRVDQEIELLAPNLNPTLNFRRGTYVTFFMPICVEPRLPIQH